MLSAATDPLDCNSYWAQGGIIYKAEDDTPDLLASDIHYAGANVCDDEAVDFLTHNGPSAVDELLIGTSHVPFDRRPDGKLALCLEASHNRARIIHWKDHTGKAITQSIQAAAAAHPNITLETGCTAVDLAQALGPYGSHCVAPPRSGTGPRRPSWPRPRCWRRAASATCTRTRPTRPARAATASPWPCAWAPSCRAWSVQFHPTTLYLRAPLPAHGGPLGGGRPAAEHGRGALRRPVPRARRAGPPGRGRADDRLGDAAPGLRARVPGHQPPRRGLPQGPVPLDLRALPGPGPGPDGRPGAHCAGRALLLRWRGSGHGRAHLGARPVCGRGDGLHGPARGQSAGLHLAAGGPRMGPRDRGLPRAAPARGRDGPRQPNGGPVQALWCGRGRPGGGGGSVR
ncbi:unnamed protein product [Heterosigma akashiwo]